MSFRKFTPLNVAFDSFLMRWMKLEPTIQNEVSQKEKDKHHLCNLCNLCYPKEKCISPLNSLKPSFYKSEYSISEWSKKTFSKF